MPAPKRTQMIRAVNRLDTVLASMHDDAWRAKALNWLTVEIQALTKRHAVALPIGGEGVSTASPTGNPNQSPPLPENPQCPVPGPGQNQLPAPPPPMNPNLNPPMPAGSASVSGPGDWAGHDLAPQPVVPVPVPSHPDTLIWPGEAELTVLGFVQNPKLLAAALPDGTRVSLYRGVRNWRKGDRVMGRLSVGGGSPVYGAV